MDPIYVSRQSRFIAALALVLAAGFVAMAVAGTTATGDLSYLLVAGFALPLGLHGVNALRSRVEVYPSEIVVRKLTSTRRYAWHEIAEVHHRPARALFAVAGALLLRWTVAGPSGAERLSLRTRDGKTIRFNQSISGSDLVGHVQSATLGHLMHIYGNTLASGGRVTLGPVEMHRNTGIEVRQIRRTVIQWDELERYEVKRGNLGLKRRDARRATWVPAEKVPNLHVLLALIDELTHRPVAAL